MDNGLAYGVTVSGNSEGIKDKKKSRDYNLGGK